MRRDLFAPGHEADVFTFHAAHELLPTELSQAIVRESRLARLPGIRQRGHASGRWRYLLPYMPLYYRGLDLDSYDLVISSSHACAVNVRPRPDALHVVYCYTPMRYAWMQETDGRRLTGARGLTLRAATAGLREVDRRAARRPDAFVAISTAVQERIARFYGRESTVIHPPVDVEDFTGYPREGAGALPLGASPGFVQASAARRRGVPRSPVPTDDGRDRPAGERAARDASAQRRAQELGLAGGARRPLCVGVGLHPRRRGGLRYHDGRGDGLRDACDRARPRRCSGHRPTRDRWPPAVAARCSRSAERPRSYRV